LIINNEEIAMKRLLKLPLRFKILISLLIVVTIVVSIITFTMAKMFHSDKSTYVHDLTSVMAVNTSQEVRSLLDGYKERLLVFTRFIYSRDMNQKQKKRFLKEIFTDFQEFVAVTINEVGLDPVTIYDKASLESAGLTKDDIISVRNDGSDDNPFPVEEIRKGRVFVENSTISEKLPTFTISIPYSSSDLDEPAVISAIIRLDSMIGLTRESKVVESFVVDSRGILMVHSDIKKIAEHMNVDWIPELESLNIEQSLGVTREYVKDDKEMVGGFTRLDFGNVLVGAQIAKTAAYLTERELLNNLLVVALILLAIAAVLSLFWAQRITRPIEELSEATKEIGKGQFDVKIDLKSKDEIGELAGSFSTMATELDSREKALKDAQAALIQSEKMAAFGQLGAGIAHEVKNPLAGILGFAQLSLRKLDKEDPLYENVSVIESETKRCKNIIDNLMKFARQEKVAHEITDINTIVEDAVTILNHQLGVNQVQLEKELGSDLPKVMINANQIQQVLMNLIINAQQAMDGKPGMVIVKTDKTDSGTVEISVTDNGPGIPEEIREKIFEPFFTTKPVGKGTGLGLSVSYGIIKDHKGNIRIESEPGEGTTFNISLPVYDKSDEPHQSGHETD
jgi:two-component system NtrC family sensor kinase